MPDAHLYKCTSVEEPDIFADDFDPSAPTADLKLNGEPAGDITFRLPWADYCDAIKHLNERVNLTITPGEERHVLDW